MAYSRNYKFVGKLKCKTHIRQIYCHQSETNTHSDKHFNHTKQRNAPQTKKKQKTNENNKNLQKIRKHHSVTRSSTQNAKLSIETSSRIQCHESLTSSTMNWALLFHILSIAHPQLDTLEFP